MAALTKLREGSRVRLIRGVSTHYGRYIEPGIEGWVGEASPFRFADGTLCVWIWFNKNNGAWVPIGSIVRLKENICQEAATTGRRARTSRATRPRGTSRTKTKD